MQAIDFVHVTSNGLVKKRLPQGRGGGGRLFFAFRCPKFDPVSQSTKRTGNDLQFSTARLRLACARDQVDVRRFPRSENPDLGHPASPPIIVMNKIVKWSISKTKAAS